MIILIKDASTEILGRLAKLLEEDESCREMSSIMNDKSTLDWLRNLGPQWRILIHDQRLALFSFTVATGHVTINSLAPQSSDVITTVTEQLAEQMGKMKLHDITITVDEKLGKSIVEQGFKEKGTMIRCSVPVNETRLMPILQLANPTTKDIPLLAKLMYDSYARSGTQRYANVESAAKHLQDIMSGAEGSFLGDCSYVSGSSGNHVSVCLITSSSSSVATVSELFTHPLYRARGLATVEISSALNRLSKQNFSELQVWLDGRNDLARRLFSKLGFTEHGQRTVVFRSLE